MTQLDRRRFLTRGATLGASCLLAPRLLAGQARSSQPRRVTRGMITPATRRAIQSGLEYLAKVQVGRGRNKGALGYGGYNGGVAVCGLAGLAFLCAGNPPGRGPYGRHVELCVDYLLSRQQESGYITIYPGGRDNMYGHGFATLFLAEAYGMSMHQDRDERLKKKLRAAIDLIVRAQNAAGGWRYRPERSDADLSITICQIMALRAARDAGIYVPEKTRKLCIQYVKRSQNPDGGFRYTLGGGGSSFPLTGAGLVSLYSAGIYTGEAIEKGLKWLMNNISRTRWQSGSYYFYGNYYAVQAAWHAGGDYWKKWYPAIRDELVRNQSSNGSWQSSYSAEFGTAMACIILQMPHNYVPVFSEG